MNLFDDPLPIISIGNKYTLKTRPLELGVDVREELLKYHAKYYSSNLMTLAIVGKGLYWSICMAVFIVSVCERTCTVID